MVDVGRAVPVGGGVSVSVDVKSASGTTIGLDVWHANKNSKINMAAGQGLIFIWLILLEN